MSKILIPSDVTVEIPRVRADLEDTKQTIAFGRDFMIRVLLSDQQWGATLDDVFACMTLRSAFLNAKPGDKIEIAKDHLTKLQERMRRPTNPYNPTIASQLGPFFDAILKPED